MRKQQRYEAIDVGERFGTAATWGVMANRGLTSGWELLCVGCTRHNAERIAREMDEKASRSAAEAK